MKRTQQEDRPAASHFIGIRKETQEPSGYLSEWDKQVVTRFDFRSLASKHKADLGNRGNSR